MKTSLVIEMATSTIIVGFDGGGTQSRIIIRDENASLIRKNFPLSIKYTDIGVGESVRRFAEMLQSLAPIESWDKAIITISLSGASNESKNYEFKELLTTIFSEKEIQCHIESDSSLSLKTAYPNNESGYLLIAGTGSVAMARDRIGAIHKAGGFGRLLGDEGSGYWIGVQALKQVLSLADQNLAPTMLSAAIESALRPETGGDFSILRSKLYSNEINPAMLAPIVFECADDPLALAILQEGSRSLATLIGILQRKADGNIERVVTLHGSVCCNPIYSELISQALDDEYEIRTMDEWMVAEYCLNLPQMI